MTNSHPTIPALPQDVGGLAEIAGNLWWSWHIEARLLFKMLDRQAWKESGHNPVKMMRMLPADALKEATARPEWRRLYDRVTARFHAQEGALAGWFDAHVDDPKHYPVAYFSAEYGLHHSLPFYAGGLGFLAGDFLKEMSDLAAPVAAVGFMYPEGYVGQKIRDDGWQESEDQVLDRDAASIAKVLGPGGKPLLVKVPLIDPPILVTVWEVPVGRARLYLLDTDIAENEPWNRRISQHLYSGDLEQRLQQEIVLGIGGFQVLAELGISHVILHLNEGHAAFAILERVRERVGAGADFAAAAASVRAATVFTTHTPVPAGHDIFPFDLIDKYFHSYWPALGIGRDEFLALGVHPREPASGFNMTALALRMSDFRNGVSRRHGEVARRMWQPLWPDKAVGEVPIVHITNGVHAPTWISPRILALFHKHLGIDWMDRIDDPSVWDRVDDIPDEALWRTHYWLKIKLVDAVRELARQRWARDHPSPSLMVAEGAFLDPAVLTVGFARRFVTYKRADLVFTDPARLIKILNDRWRPVQIIFAGKAHPSDDPAKRILQRVVNTARDPGLAGRVAFVEDYGEQFAQHMVHGVDVWLNNPRPPLEACGTSGMKAALNGIPQLSIRDGWWVEGFNGKNGWAFGPEDALEARGPEADPADAAQIYDILENEVIPLYYRDGPDGFKQEWVGLMKETIKSAGRQFTSRRMVREYIERFYVPALKKS